MSLSLPTLETGSRPFYYLGEYLLFYTSSTAFPQAFHNLSTRFHKLHSCAFCGIFAMDMGIIFMIPLNKRVVSCQAEVEVLLHGYNYNYAPNLAFGLGNVPMPSYGMSKVAESFITQRAAEGAEKKFEEMSLDRMVEKHRRELNRIPKVRQVPPEQTKVMERRSNVQPTYNEYNKRSAETESDQQREKRSPPGMVRTLPVISLKLF